MDEIPVTYNLTSILSGADAQREIHVGPVPIQRRQRLPYGIGAAAAITYLLAIWKTGFGRFVYSLFSPLGVYGMLPTIIGLGFVGIIVIGLPIMFATMRTETGQTLSRASWSLISSRGQIGQVHLGISPIQPDALLVKVKRTTRL